MSLGRKLEGTAYAVLNELLSGYHGTGGFSRPSRYEVLIIPPRGSNNNPTSGDISNNKTIRETSLACESISFPGRNIDTTTDTNIYGPTREIASGFSYAEVSATFRCSSDMKEKLYFESWQKQSFNTQTWSMQYYEDYIGAVQIFQLDENDNRTYGCELIDCFPKTVTDLSVSQGVSSDIQKLSVKWTYRHWKNTEFDSGNDLGTRIVDAVKNTVTRRITSQIPSVLRRL